MLRLNQHRTANALAFLSILLLLASPRQAAASHHGHHAATATYFSRGDSNPHLANGDTYGHSGPWFCAVDASRRDLLNHRIRVINTRNGRSHVFLVADLGRFSRGNIDISRGGSARLTGRGGPDNFPVRWVDLGPASGHGKQRRRQSRHH